MPTRSRHTVADEMLPAGWRAGGQAGLGGLAGWQAAWQAGAGWLGRRAGAEHYVQRSQASTPAHSPAAASCCMLS